MLESHTEGLCSSCRFRWRFPVFSSVQTSQALRGLGRKEPDIFSLFFSLPHLLYLFAIVAYSMYYATLAIHQLISLDRGEQKEEKEGVLRADLCQIRSQSLP